MKMNMLKCGAVCVFVSLFGGPVARAQQPGITPERARAVRVRLVMAQTTTTGALVNGASATTDALLPLGESRTLWGWIDRSDGTRCPTAAANGIYTGRPYDNMVRIGGDPRLLDWRQPDKRPLTAWSVDMRIEDARVDSVTLNLTIRKVTRGPDQPLGTPAMAMRTVKLTPQQPYVIGVADQADFPGCDWSNVMVQLFAEPTSLAPIGAVLEYELWLQHVSAKGERMVDSGRVVSREGDLTHIELKPFTWPIPGTSCSIRMDLSADVRGWVRQDGLIDLSVTPNRTFRVLVPQRTVTPNFTRGSGVKTLVAKSGEAVEFVLPEPAEQFQSAPCGLPGTAFQNFVDLSTFFDGHKTSLILSVRKE